MKKVMPNKLGTNNRGENLLESFDWLEPKRSLGSLFNRGLPLPPPPFSRKSWNIFGIFFLVSFEFCINKNNTIVQQACLMCCLLTVLQTGFTRTV